MHQKVDIVIDSIAGLVGKMLNKQFISMISDHKEREWIWKGIMLKLNWLPEKKSLGDLTKKGVLKSSSLTRA